MLIRFLRLSLSSIVFLTISTYSAYAQNGETSHPDVTVRTSAANNRTRLDIRVKGGKRYVMLVKRDPYVLFSDDAERVKVVGYIKDTAVILLDTYQSKPNGTSNCQAGEEQFLRIISIKGSQPVETFKMKTSSCYENIEMNTDGEQDGGIEWLPELSTLRIHPLGSGGNDIIHTIRIDSEGRPVEENVVWKTYSDHPDVTVRTRALNNRTQMDIQIKGGNRYMITVKRGRGVFFSDDTKRVKVVGYLKDTAVILLDTYPSVYAGTGKYCSADAEEQFLRVISIKGKQPVETFVHQTRSCEKVEPDMEYGVEGVEWIPETSTVRMRLRDVYLPDKEGPGPFKLHTIRVDSRGRGVEESSDHR
jgi:uncharacterized short protein YbdD (DUF466 family)